ncbi:ShlB/FhaC/HecB family hemolysin secretion/activation protein [Croceicoccus naphthovorans]|uniref:ShlB/FhaC/HecB family hemolysin secretion/activation protein n=1 Tax=Croceicoccus naphthovorans TaxID=1348774 RepID=UPI0009E37FD0|nr:ShlB/FhaC/HecB family hemolysin secretion/activation protein [Croceicoccus naphthovorans]MBB3989517.1 hemolysin activation/secretion protein [Croceicoccus naphthovorans]
MRVGIATILTNRRPASPRRRIRQGVKVLRFDKAQWRRGPSAVVIAAALGFAATPTFAQEAAEPAVTFDIRAFQVKGNDVLPPDAVERAIYPYMGPDKTEADVEAARAALQQAFEDAGYIAVSVFIPEQSVDGGILQLAVQPQTIGQVLVEGARDPEAVRAEAPSLTPGTTPNLPEFQRDVVALNQNPSRRVTPELRAGEAPGTLDVVLTVEESSPFHASAEINNFNSAATTDLRVAGTLRYDNMWGRGDSLSISAQTAPERTDDGTVISGNYLMRLGTGTQLLLYGVHSDSDIAVVGGTNVIGRGNMAGVRLIRSLGSSDGFYHSLTLGMDWKDFEEDVLLGSDRASAPIEYFPIMASWRGDWTTDRRRSDITLSTVFGIRGLGDGWRRFDDKRYNARPSFFTIKLDASHTEDVMAGLQFHSAVTGQWSPDPLISNEGFSLGGMSSVRGYYETEHIADYGFAIQTELRSPDFGPLLGGPIDELRLHAFWDSGLGGIHDPLSGQDDDFGLSSVGLGGRIKLFRYFNGAVDVGVPLVSGSESESGEIFTRFRIWGEF